MRYRPAKPTSPSRWDRCHHCKPFIAGQIDNRKIRDRGFDQRHGFLGTYVDLFICPHRRGSMKSPPKTSKRLPDAVTIKAASEVTCAIVSFRQSAAIDCDSNRGLRLSAHATAARATIAGTNMCQIVLIADSPLWADTAQRNVSF
jgi:hypothetical protein